MTCLREGVVTLRDGRRLGYGEYGVRGGRPVLLFHGMPGGRAYELDPVRLVARGVWLFTLERPGVGLSNPDPRASLLDWARDIVTFADEFGLERFAILAFSAGATLGLACAFVAPERVAALGLACGFVPLVEHPELDHLLSPSAADKLRRYRSDPEQYLTEELELFQRQCASWAQDPDRFYEESFGPVDEFWALPKSYWMRLLAGVYGRPPTDDDRADLAIPYAPWGFEIESIEVPIHAWHGGADELVPIGLVEEFIRRVSHGTLTSYPSESHFLDWSHTDEYLEALTDW